MLMSDKNKTIIDACRFCWMCRHICPIGNVTGQERNNARGRALSLSMISRGMEFSGDMVENVYECALCGACTNDCVTGFDPVEFTKAARLEGALEGLTPNYIIKMADNIEATGNPYGEAKISKTLSDEIKSLSDESDTLLFLGADARYKSPKSALNAIKLFKKANVSFTVLADEPDSGYCMDVLFSKADETKRIMQNAADVLSGFKTVIAYDPADAKVFFREYKEWGIEITPTVKTFTSYINKLIQNKALSPEKSNKTVVFQDPALLSRDLEETVEARDVLNACVDTKEMLLHGKHTVWAGNLIMNDYMPDVMKMTAAVRWKSALSAGAEALVTASPSEYEILAKVKPESMELFSIEEIVLGGLK